MMGIVAVSLSRSRMWLSSSLETFAITYPIWLVFFCHSIFSSSVIILFSSCSVGIICMSVVVHLEGVEGVWGVIDKLVLQHVSGHLCKVVHPSFQLIVELCCCNQGSSMMVLSLTMFAMVNDILSIYSLMVSFSDVFWLMAPALFRVLSTLNSGLGDSRLYVCIWCCHTRSLCIKFAVAPLSRSAMVETDWFC